MKTKLQIIEDYLEAISVSLQRSGVNEFWPFGPGQVDSYFEDILSITLFEKFKEDPQKFKKALSQVPANYLRWYFLPFVVLGLKLARNFDNYQVKNEEMVDFISATWTVLSEKVYSDPFCIDGQSLIIPQGDIEAVIKKQLWLGIIAKKPVNILGMDIEAFVWSIDFDLFAYGVFWHGPYFLSTGQTLLVKSFQDLDSSVWNLKQQYSNIEIFYLFDSKIEATIDFMGHILFKSDIWQYLSKVSVVIDGQSLKSIPEIEQISSYFAAISKTQVEIVKKMKPEELIVKGGEVYYYMLHKFFNYYKEDWRPPETFYFRVKKWGTQYWDQFKPNTSVQKKINNDFFKKLYDPENSFTD